MFTVSDGTNSASAAFTLAPARIPVGMTRERQRAEHMERSVAIFPPADERSSTQLANSVEQGYSGGDSLFAASMIAAVRQNGFAWLAGRIQLAPSGNGYEVLFNSEVLLPGGGQIQPFWVSVGPLTPEDFQVYGCTSDGSLWYTIYEKGYARYNRFPFTVPTLVATGGYTQPAPTLGRSGVAMARLTGRPAADVPITWDLATELQTQAALVAQLGAAGAIMTASTNSSFGAVQQDQATQYGIVASSSYAVIGYDAESMTVELLDPHNLSSAGTPREVPLGVFQILFGSLTSVPAV